MPVFNFINTLRKSNPLCKVDKVLFFLLFVLGCVSLVFCGLTLRFFDTWWISAVQYSNILIVVLSVVRLRSFFLAGTVLLGAVLLPAYTVIPYSNLVDEKAITLKLVDVEQSDSGKFLLLQFDKKSENVLIHVLRDKTTNEETVDCYGRFYPYRAWFCRDLYHRYKSPGHD